jgi:F-type H+-transporting ATPase subunit epsilon
VEGEPVTLHVELVVPDREIWSGSARMVIAKTIDGDIGVMQSHPPVIGLLAEGSLVRILDAEASGEPGSDGSGSDGSGSGSGSGSGETAGELVAAVSGGFLSVAGDRISILARQAELGRDVDVSAAKAELDEAETASQPGTEESAETRYARARLRATGEQA